jgi:hypothetical protein
MAAFSASIDETCTFKLSNKFPYLLWHKLTFGYFVAALELVNILKMLDAYICICNDG